MTAHSMKTIDLKRWNLVQMMLLQRIGLPLEPETLLVFGEWFSSEVDNLRRLPRLSEVRQAQPILLCSCSPVNEQAA